MRAVLAVDGYGVRLPVHRGRLYADMAPKDLTMQAVGTLFLLAGLNIQRERQATGAP
jgi:hypothetical protein